MRENGGDQRGGIGQSYGGRGDFRWTDRLFSIIVGGLAGGANAVDVRNVFSQFGRVKDVFCLTRDGKPRGFVFVR